jgi:hypothetical protein
MLMAFKNTFTVFQRYKDIIKGPEKGRFALFTWIIFIF